ncbi:hypothetical protein GWK47_038350 [Chionoecetes opilio]|uniref:Uncharacterized protein n=1 Tax=Chionoecetes opilio TaxID=41210 RepID=A0A8J4YL80_CHIOP|nr:hypothetical protein GWK47_038350 [Chionoecetes opilio]
MLCLTSTRRHPQRCRTSQQKCRHRDPFQEHSTWGQHPAVGKVTRYSFHKASLIKFLVEEWKKPQHREKLEGKELYVTCEHSASRSPKSSGKRLLSLSQVKKKQTHASFSMHFMQQNLGTSLSSSLQRIQTSWSGSGHVPQDPIPPVPEVRDEEPDKIPGYHHTEPYTGGRCVIN